jgi:Ca-activated chloride channel family protein
VPAALWSRLEILGKRQEQWAKLMKWATAASLLLAMGTTFGLLLIAVVVMSLQPHGVVQPIGEQLAAEPPQAEEIGNEPLDDSGLGAEPQTPSLAEEPLPPPPGEFDLSPVAEPESAVARTERLLAGLGKDLLTDLALMRFPVTASYTRFDDLSDIKRVPGMKPLGIEYPTVPGFNIRLAADTGFRPFVAPAAHWDLRTVSVPLDGTDSYDLLRRYLEDGELPRASELHTEHFLAALDYQFPRPTQQAMGLSMAACPSPWHPTMNMLQVGVQAKENPAAQHRPVRLTLLVDISASMQWGGRLEAITQGIHALLDRLGPEDRVSLVTYHEEASLLVEDAGVDQRGLVRKAVEGLKPRGSTNLGAGLRLAYAVAERAEAGDKRPSRIVLLTDGLTQLDAASLGRAKAQMERARTAGVRLNVIDLEPERDDGGVDPLLTDLAAAGGGTVRRAAHHQHVAWALEEFVTGKSQMVAQYAKLQIEFNSRSVFAYRLLGHEPRTLLALKPATLQSPFYSGQAATALFEVQLLPNGEPEIAVAELIWREPGGEMQRLEQRFRREHVSARTLQSPPSLQAAIIASSAAEVLRGSPFLPSRPLPESLNVLARLAHEVDPGLFYRPSYVQLVTILEKAVRAKQVR